MACITLSQGIAKTCDTSMGGVKAIWLCDTSYTGASLPPEGDASTAVSIGDTTYWRRFNTRKNVSSMTSTMNIDDANGTNYVSTELNVVFARMDATKRETINVLRQCEVAAVVLDNNGNGWYLGADNPVTVTAGTGNTGTAIGDGNNYNVTLTDTSLNLPRIVESESITKLLLIEG